MSVRPEAGWFNEGLQQPGRPAASPRSRLPPEQEFVVAEFVTAIPAAREWRGNGRKAYLEDGPWLHCRV